MKVDFEIKNLSNADISSFKVILEDLVSFAQKRLKYDQPVKVLLISDPENSINVLGKTAHYQPSTKTVTIYVDKRHPKDILRSVAHELVHHAQNCRGDFNTPSKMEVGYAQEDGHLREMEREAYEQGNLIFRDFEDGIKTNKKKQTNYIIAINEGFIMNEYGDHETRASGGLVASNYSSDPEMDFVEDIARDVTENGGQLMQIATALQDEGFDAQIHSGALIIDNKYFIGKPHNFDIEGEEEIREIDPYVLGYQSMNEGWVTSPAVDYCGGNCKSEAEASKQCGAVGVSLEEQELDEYEDYSYDGEYAPYTQDMGGGGLLNWLTRSLRVREGKVDRDQLREIVRKALQQEVHVNCEFGGPQQIVPENAGNISKAFRQDPTEPDPHYHKGCSGKGIGLEETFKGNSIMKNKNKLGLTSLNENWNKFLEEGGDKRKQKWMQAFQNAAGNPQPPPQDFWDTATYLYSKGDDPVEAGKQYAANNMNEAHQPWRGKRTMADLDKDAKTRETDFLKKGSEPQQGDDVSVVSGGLAGAYGEVMELTTTTEGEPGVVIYLHKDANKRVMGAKGDEVVAKISDVEVDKGIQAEVKDVTPPGYGPEAEGDYSWSQTSDNVLELKDGRGEVWGSIEKASGSRWNVYDDDGYEPITVAYDIESAKSELLDLLDIADKAINEMYGEDDDYFDALEAEFPFLSKAVKAGEVPEEVAADIAKEYGDKKEPQELPMSEPVEEADEGGEGVHDIFNLPEPEEAESTGNPKEDAIRKIVSDKQHASVDGIDLDLYSASAIVKVLDAINDQNKEKYLAMDVANMVEIAFKMLK